MVTFRWDCFRRTSTVGPPGLIRLINFTQCQTCEIYNPKKRMGKITHHQLWQSVPKRETKKWKRKWPTCVSVCLCPYANVCARVFVCWKEWMEGFAKITQELNLQLFCTVEYTECRDLSQTVCVIFTTIESIWCGLHASMSQMSIARIRQNCLFCYAHCDHIPNMKDLCTRLLLTRP